MKHSILAVGCLLLTGLCWQVGAFDDGDLKKLLETNECRNCDLENANLTEANLEGVNLTNANMKKANLRKAILTRVIFCRTIMPNNTLNKTGC